MKHTIVGKITGILDEDRDDMIGMVVKTDHTSHGFAVPLAEAAGMQLRDVVYITVSDASETAPVPLGYEAAIERLRAAHKKIVEASNDYAAFGGIREPDHRDNLRERYAAASTAFLDALQAITGVKDEQHAAVDTF